MAIPMAMVLGFALLFFVFAVIHWSRELLVIRREGRRGKSAIVPVSVHSGSGGREAEARINERREVIVMGRPASGKQNKRVVA